MAKTSKAYARDKKSHKAKHGMKVSNRSIFVVVATIGNKTGKVK